MRPAPPRRALAVARRLPASLATGRRRLLAGPLAVVGIAVVAGSFLFGLGGTTTAAQPRVSTNPGLIKAGEYLFNTHCSSCHGIAGVGTKRAPALVFVGAAASDFYLQTGRMPLNDPTNEALRHHRIFNQQQIMEINSYVADLPRINGKKGSGPGIPSVLPLCTGSQASNTGKIAAQQAAGTANCVTLSFGQHNFALNCAQCHQIAGSGGMLSKGFVIPTLQNASLDEIGEAMRVGPLPMPKFGPGQLNEVQMSAIARYVKYLQQPDHPGGLRISGFGPVAEGFVGIILGLGLLLVVARLMGTRG